MIFAAERVTGELGGLGGYMFAGGCELVWPGIKDD